MAPEPTPILPDESQSITSAEKAAPCMGSYLAQFRKKSSKSKPNQGQENNKVAGLAQISDAELV